MAVIGCGGVGQAVIQGARIAGAARIIAIDPVAMKRDAALQFGATDVVDPGDADPIEAVRALSGGRGADYAFEVIGTAGTIRQAVETTRPGGTAVMVGVPKLGTDVSIPAMSVLEEKTILGCVYGSAQRAARLPAADQPDRAGQARRRFDGDAHHAPGRGQRRDQGDAGR